MGLYNDDSSIRELADLLNIPQICQMATVEAMIMGAVSDIEMLKSANTQKNTRIAELEADLLEFGRHAEHCYYVYDAAAGCKCGWLEIEQALKGGEK